MRRCCVWLVGALSAARVCAAPVLVPTTGPDPKLLPPVAATARPGLYIAPYLQDPGPDHGVLRFETATAQAATITLTPSAGGPAVTTQDPPLRLHEVRATGLEPSTRYHWAVTLAGQEAGTADMTTWPTRPTQVRFFIYGDTRTNPDKHARIARAMAARADGHLFVIHSGDLVARGNTYSLWKREFFDPAAPLLAKVPIFPVAGNHEEGTELMRAYFTLPDPEYYWSFECGPVHVLGLAQYLGLSGGDWTQTPQGKWLPAAMAAATAPWKLAMFHAPLYSLGPHGKEDDEPDEGPVPHEKEIAWARHFLEPLLRQYGYQMTVNGHDHAYERSYKDGLVMLTSGGGGAPLYNARDPKQNPYSQVFASTTHFVDATADADSLELRAFDADGKALDAVRLTHRQPYGANVEVLK